MDAKAASLSIQQQGAIAANAKRTPEERHKLSSKAARRGWRGHKKNNKECTCIMCTKRRLKKQ